MPEDFHVSLLPRAHEEGAVYGSKAGEPPLMLAFSVREALRKPRRVRSGRSSASTSPRRRRRGGLLGGRAGAPRRRARTCRGRLPRRRPRSAAGRRAAVPAGVRGGAAPEPAGTCNELAERGRDTAAGAPTRRARHRRLFAGHAPRDPGAKMVVSVDATWGTIGGGTSRRPRSRALVSCWSRG